jgi:hypothetical protein
MPRRGSLLLRTITTAIAITAATASNPIHVSVTPDSLTGLPNNFLLRGRQILQGMPVRRFRIRIAFRLAFCLRGRLQYCTVRPKRRMPL